MTPEDAPKLEGDTLDLLFALSKGSPAGQLRASDAVDAKITQAVAAASVLIGLAAVRGPKHDNLETAFLAGAVAAFLILAIVAIEALWSRRYRLEMSPEQLWQRYWLDTPTTIKHAFVADVASGYPVNAKHLRSKHKALRVVLVALMVEAGAIGAALLVAAVRG